MNDPFNGFDFKDIKIKKKKKPESETNKDNMNNQDFNMMHEAGSLKTHRVSEMNVIKLYNDIIEMTTKDEKLFNFIRSLVINKKQHLAEKDKYLKRKWYHLKNSNLSEKEYRMKEKALTQSGVDDVKEIKDSMYQSLSEEKVKGFESRERLLQKIILE